MKRESTPAGEGMAVSMIALFVVIALFFWQPFLVFVAIIAGVVIQIITEIVVSIRKGASK